MLKSSSSHRFPYDYLVTTSPPLLTPGSIAPIRRHLAKNQLR